MIYNSFACNAFPLMFDEILPFTKTLSTIITLEVLCIFIWPNFLFLVDIILIKNSISGYKKVSTTFTYYFINNDIMFIDHRNCILEHIPASEFIFVGTLQIDVK